MSLFLFFTKKVRDGGPAHVDPDQPAGLLRLQVDPAGVPGGHGEGGVGGHLPGGAGPRDDARAGGGVRAARLHGGLAQGGRQEGVPGVRRRQEGALRGGLGDQVGKFLSQRCRKLAWK